MADRDGGAATGPPVRLGGRRVGVPVRTGWDGFDEARPVSLDDLADVEAPDAPTPASPAVLVRGADGVYRPVPPEQVNPQRGSVNFLIDALSDAPDELLVGDFLTVLAGLDAGTVYEVRED